ncbi:MAG: cysteine synthase A [Bacteroidales bacterium]|nr:cysteine synthase A [Bacteroidales bacterium]
MYYKNLTSLIGNTPMVEAAPVEGQQARIILKLELFNPGGSVKDRIALAMIEDAERNGTLQPGGTIIEPTSGNTGIGLAWVGRARGYRVILTMPESMSIERRNLQKAFGAELELTPAAEGMAGTLKKAEELRQSIPGAVILGQFDNPANPAIHERTTGEEIWHDTEGEVDVFVAGVGTGGTVSGVGHTLKRHKASVEIVAVEPSTSQMLAKGEAGPHKIQGIGANFVPKNFDRGTVDQILPISTEQAFDAMRLLASQMGLLVGISSGAAYAAALELAAKPEYKGKTIVALLPDTGERYLSMIS